MDPSFATMPIIDSHIHFIHPERMAEVLGLMDAVPCSRFNLVCLPEQDGGSQNPIAIAFKNLYPQRVYVSGALDYQPVLTDPISAPKALAEQVSALKAGGFDGLKMIEGKPQVRRMIPYALDGPMYAGVWAALEMEAFPVVLHVADPRAFWDRESCPEWAREAGWDYSSGAYPTRESLYAEVRRVLERHPRLRLILAHFAFLADDLPCAAHFLDSHPSVCFDLAPHMDMYREFSQTPLETRTFFLRYQERILYGTDIDTRALVRGESGAAFMRHIPWLIRSFLENTGGFSKDGRPLYYGLGLPPDVLEQIYHGNFERLFGAFPALPGQAGSSKGEQPVVSNL